jgi:hypothetical protein
MKILDIGKTFHTTLIKKGEKIKGTQREQSSTFNDKCCSEEDNFHHSKIFWMCLETLLVNRRKI